MATNLKNLSDYDKSKSYNVSEFSFGIVVAEWNQQITDSLYQGARKVLLENNVKEENIVKIEVPGTFELTYGAKFLADNFQLNAIIVLGTVIQGETRHFDYICNSVTQGITELNLKYDIPFIFGVLTTNDIQQAIDRSGGKHGNKGDESAITAIKMACLKNTYLISK
jgi:6,7-dimethyl-8-ribityllumazine synthase